MRHAGKFFRIGVCVPATCEYEGAIHQTGESFPAADGCNTCTCDEDGQVFCTERACVCNFEDPKRSYTARDADTCATIRFICAPGWQPFFDACGCGCERSCHVGGCSGQLCVAPGEPDITTCEWRDEYACYADATCELQEDGSCGWTPTEELEACLAEVGATD